jgi:formylglycine-generating enzyme required for sulfatase activity
MRMTATRPAQGREAAWTRTGLGLGPRSLAAIAAIGVITTLSGCVPGESDDPAWNRGAVCGNKTCEAGETASNCAVDCGGGKDAVCGNGKCESGETKTSCPDDCKDVANTVCGNNNCEPGENNDSCPADCPLESVCTKDEECGTNSNACLKNICSAGKCDVKQATAGLECDDGNLCTTGEACKEGLCTGGKEPDCDDGNACTVDECESANGTCANTPAPDDTKCDDDNPCTNDDRCKAGECTTYKTWTCQCNKDVPNDDAEFGCAKFSPANKCNGESKCLLKADGTQKCEVPENTKVFCDPSESTACADHVCDSKTGGCIYKPKAGSKPCDDGDACTQSDACDAGECVPGTQVCECTPKTAQEACSKIYQGSSDPCKGTWFCANAGVGPYSAGATEAQKKLKTHCEINPNTTINCETKNDNVCVQTQCVVEGDTGSCKKLFSEKFCDDGNDCTQNDKCKDGACLGGEPNTCTCTKDADCLAGKDGKTGGDDGNLCNGVPYCDQQLGKCVLNPASIVTCSSLEDGACIVNICDPAVGVCKLTPRENLIDEFEISIETQPSGEKVVVKTLLGVKIAPKKVKDVYCEDGNPCTPVDACSKGVCKPDDTNICPCTADADCAAKDDGNLCNGVAYCDKISGECKLNPTSVVKCSSGNDTTCAKNVCHPKDGKCKVTPVVGTVYCDDGDPCTAVSDCDPKTGVCKPGTAICPCQADADCNDQEDGNPCNGTLYCDKISASCKVNPATIVHCPGGSDTDCLTNQCNKKTGKCQLTPANEYKSCDDGDPCSASPVCIKGVCFAESKLCACTVDADCAPLKSKNLCAGDLYCDKSGGKPETFTCKTKPGTVVSCDSSSDTACANNKCDPATGKCAVVAKPDNVILCDDGNPCTVGDSCIGGKCAPGTNNCGCTVDADCDALDDGNDCNGKLICDKSAGSAFKCKTDPATIPVCNAATPGSCIVEKCLPASGKCESVSADVCDDKNPCTIDFCDTKTDSCTSQPVPDASPCVGSLGAGVCNATGATSSSCLYTLQPEMVLIPKGTFFQGCAAKEGTACKSEEQPQHEVELNAYWIDRFEVTVARYKACVADGTCKAPVMTGPGCTFAGSETAEHPINCVTKQEATTYCTWYGSKAAKAAKGRLPSEAEWERAARGGCELYPSGECKTQVVTYVWGDTPAPSCKQAIVKDGTGAGCDGTKTVPIVARPGTDRSLYDVYDLGGSVSEWVLDVFSSTYYASLGGATKNPVNTASGTDTVVRGASYASDKTDLRAARRASSAASSQSIGFRCVIEL